MSKFNRFAYVYCKIRSKHPNWVHKQISHATVYALKGRRKQMNKAILVTDIPNECRDCACFDSNDFGTFCGATDKEIIYNYDKYEYTKPNWCPLKEMPKELVYGKTCNDLSYTDGYNACIDQILGKK